MEDKVWGLDQDCDQECWEELCNSSSFFVFTITFFFLDVATLLFQKLCDLVDAFISNILSKNDREVFPAIDIDKTWDVGSLIRNELS